MSKYEVKREDIKIPKGLTEQEQEKYKSYSEIIRENFRDYVERQDKMILEQIVKHKNFGDMFYEITRDKRLLFTKEQLREVFEFYNKWHDRVDELEKLGETEWTN